MFYKNEVTFLLGAGASWHYGYHTGEDLVKRVIQSAIIARDRFQRAKNENSVIFPAYVKAKLPDHASIQNYQKAWQSTADECQNLIDRLTHVNPPVIDYFLGQSPGLGEIGKLIIAWVILECEHHYYTQGGNLNRRHILKNSPLPSERDNAAHVNIKHYKDDWLRFVLYKLVSGITDSSQLLQSKVTFVTFNYDVSLERKLYHGLLAIELFKPEHVKEFLDKVRVIHIYGKIYDKPVWETSPINFDVVSDEAPPKYRDDSRKWHQDFAAFLDVVYEASKGLRVISDEKGLDANSIIHAIEVIKRARDIYILGYGFDEINTTRLALSESLWIDKIREAKNIYFTNFGDRNTVNKTAGRLFFKNPGTFLPSQPSINEILKTVTIGTGGSTVVRVAYEKSVRDVYQALEQDFEFLE